MKLLDEIKKEIKSDFDVHCDTIKTEMFKEMHEAMEKFTPKSIIIDTKIVDFKKSSKIAHHESFDKIMRCVCLNIPVFLTGDAGSGKTTIAEQCAVGLDLPYYCVSVCLQTSESTFLGYKNAVGNYIRTLFRDAYENGGVFLIDEIDNGNPNVISVLNSALANDVCAFPDGMIKKHENFRLIASGNTIGRGASRKYVGRLEMDLATLDRFAVITVDYDEKIEKELGIKEIINLVQNIRKNVFHKKIRMIVSPRATMNISKLVSSGMSVEDAVDICIFKGCDESIRDQLKECLKKKDQAIESD